MRAILFSACASAAVLAAAWDPALAGSPGSDWPSMAAAQWRGPSGHGSVIDAAFRGGFRGGGGFDRGGFHNNVVVNRNVNVGGYRDGYGYGWGGVAAGAAVGTAVGAAAASTTYAADAYPYGYPYPSY